MSLENHEFSTEVTQLAQLLRVPAVSSKLSDQNMSLDKLDYHGISLLVKKNETLNKTILKALGPRQQMMIANELLKQQCLTDLFNAFHSNNLKQTLIIKGTALAYSVYAQPWLRPRSDTDIIVKECQLLKYQAIFKQLGFQKQFAIEGRFLSYQCTWSKKLSKNVSIHIDCHWRLSNRQILANIFSFDDLIHKSTTAHKLSSTNLIPCKINSIYIAALHRVGHHSNEERLIWLYDIHLLANSLNDEEWCSFYNTAIEKKITAICLEALLGCRNLFTTNIPENVIQELELASDTKEESAFFLNRQHPEWRYLLYDIRGLPNLTSKLSFLKENIFPSASYLKQRMGTNSVIKAHFYRISNGFRRLTK